MEGCTTTGDALAYEVNSPRVLGETVDGETVIIDSHTGTYYSLNESATHIWSAVKEGPVAVAAVAEAVAALYGIDPQMASTACSSLLSQLRHHEIVRPATARPEASVRLASERTLTYAEPMLERFDDLEYLLLLDPIHEVAPEQGWPVAKPPQS